MADGGVKMGLSRDLALKLTMQTMKGASELMQKQHGIKHVMQMKDEVCSPGGTTIEGVLSIQIKFANFLSKLFFILRCSCT